MKMLKNLIGLIAAAMMVFATPALAVGTFPGYPVQGQITGSETVPADTNSTVGNQTVLITTANLAGYADNYNLLTGGDFSTNPWQRGTGTSADIANTLTYWADQWWNLGGASSAINASRQTGASDITSTFNASLRFQRKSANADTTAICMGQVLETANSVNLQGQSVTFSFWALAGANFSAAAATGLNVTIGTGTGSDQSAANFAAGSWTGFASATLTPTFNNTTITAASGIAQPLTTTWTRYAWTASIPATATQVGVKICYTPVGTAGANDWVEFAGFQFEPGTSVGSFARRSNAVELMMALRYLWVLNEPAASISVAPSGQGASTTTCVLSIPTPAPMRAAPTVTFTGTALGATTWTVTHVVTNTVLSTPFLAATTGGSTSNELNVTATTGATLTAGQTCTLTGAAGGGKIQASSEL